MHTFAARTKRAAWLLLVGLSIAMLSESGVVSAAFGATTTTTTATTTTTTASASAATTPIPLSLGFNPSSVNPVSQGIPVYTVGDTIWAMSGYSSPVEVSLTSPGVSPGTTTTVLSTTLVNKDDVPLYTFASKDPDGTWSLTVTQGPGGETVVPIHFVNPVAHPVSLGPLAYSLNGGNLMVSTTASLGDSYDQEVCAAGNDTAAGLTLGLPTAMGESGNVTLSPGSQLAVTVAGTVNEPFSFWVELYQSRSLDIMNTDNLVSEDLMAADSPPVPVSASGVVNTTLAWDLPVHEGRYEMRAYFQNSTSLDVVQSSVLVLSDTSWVALNGSCPPQAVQSSDISYPASLSGGTSSWPATFYLMYQTFGVEGVESSPVMANVSSVTFTVSPWNVTSLSVSVPPSAGVAQTSQAGSSLFVLSSQYPTKVAYTLDIDGESGIAQGTATLARSYSTLSEQINLGLLTVQVISNRDLTTSLGVTGPGGISLSSAPVAVNKSASFLVPKGAYTVTGVQANVSQIAQTNVTDGATDSLTLTFHTIAAPSKAGSSYTAVELVLVAVAVVAVAANLAFRAGRSKTLGARMAKAQSDQARPS